MCVCASVECTEYTMGHMASHYIKSPMERDVCEK